MKRQAGRGPGPLEPVLAMLRREELDVTLQQRVEVDGLGVKLERSARLDPREIQQLADVRDETRAREVVRRILIENFQAEEKIDADARTLLMDNAKLIRDSASDYKRLFTMVKTKLAKERGFTL